MADITYLKVLKRWRYLAVVMDRYTRRIVGWSLGHHKTTALHLAGVVAPSPIVSLRPGLVFHSDRGVEYAAYEFRTRLAALGIRQSMNRPAEPTDNAHMESFFHSLKTERLYGCTFATDAELRGALRAYIGFYNQRRVHSGTGLPFTGRLRTRRSLAMSSYATCQRNRGKIPALRAAAQAER